MLPTALDEHTVVALRSALFSADPENPARAAIVSARRKVEPGSSHQERARAAYDQLRAVVAELGASSRIAMDPALVRSLFECSAVVTPDLFAVLSGHFVLTAGAIQRLGTASSEQRSALARLDDAEHVGVFLLTELGYGSNVLEMKTEARWDPSLRQFTLHTPDRAAVKFMPNVADGDVPKVAIVAARLIVEGRDEGVFPFLFSLRDHSGTAPGVETHRLPEKGFCPMDNAATRFDGAVVPEGGWLSGGIASFDQSGKFHSSVPSRRKRFHHTIGQLQTGRVALATGTVAAARAALSLTARYATKRRTAGGKWMLDRDNVRLPLTAAVARVYAASALGNAAWAAIEPGENASPDGAGSLLAMLAKPMLTWTALDVLQECRERMGAQGMFRANMIVDYIGITQGAITAEGDNQVLQVAAGLALAANRAALLPRPAGRVPAWQRLLDLRARALAEREGSRGGQQAMEIAEAGAAAWAAHELRSTCQDHTGAQSLLEHVAELYGTGEVLRTASWHIVHGTAEPGEIRELEGRRAQLVEELAPHLHQLIEAFGVTADLTPSAFATENYLTASLPESWTS
ncbi:acyl-CoA dehydrogenase family protein [Lentzea jiangxiensis]|uniref:Acyl-CoA oxidase n=1 Tax=Lentzea jiangxiensis TaxID=641025 RepID=A0A1H0LUV1_9PSEU|nr:acyl-CoA dehydrogenase family protein [Lentzea jiangxiensis]SDO71915.1 acyl-CoA oxidase [Lentzea jiangxiensis]